MASFKELKKGNWEVSFYCKDYLGNNKKYKKSGFKTKKEAKEYSESFIAKHTGQNEILFNDVIEDFVKYKENKVKHNTNILIKNSCSKIKEHLGHFKLNEIKEKDIYRLLEYYYNYKTISKFILIYLRLIFDYAKIYYNYKDTFYKNIKLEKRTYEKKEYNIYTLEEFKELDKVLEKNLKYRLIFNLLYFTGLRIGELTALTREDIFLKDKYIYINKTRLKNNGVNSPKTISSIRKITMPNHLIDLFSDYLNKIPNVNKSFLFANIHSITIFFKNICKKHNLKIIKLHEFRHSHASFLISRGVEITAISKRLGHSNSAITLSTYSHFYEEKQDKILNILNDNI